MAVYLGLDVHSKQTTYCVQDGSGLVIGEGSVPTSESGFSELASQFGLDGSAVAAMETGESSVRVFQWLFEHGVTAQVIDAREVRAKARRIGQKSDRRDAFELCDGIRRGVFVTRVFVPDADLVRLRRILSRRRHFVRVRAKQINAAKFVLRVEGLSWPRTLTTEAAWRKLLDSPITAPVRHHLELHFRLWRETRDIAALLELELEDALKPFAVLAQRLRTVPGVGPITSATMIATLGTPDRFPDSDAVVSYVGLAPSTHNSGDRERRGSITKRESTAMRTALCEAAHHASKPTHPLNPYFRRIAAKSGYRKAVVAVAARLARILYRMWRENNDFDVNRLGVVYDGGARTVPLGYRLRHPEERLH